MHSKAQKQLAHRRFRVLCHRRSERNHRHFVNYSDPHMTTSWNLVASRAFKAPCLPEHEMHSPFSPILSTHLLLPPHLPTALSCVRSTASPHAHALMFLTRLDHGPSRMLFVASHGMAHAPWARQRFRSCLYEHSSSSTLYNYPFNNIFCSATLTHNH